MAIRFPININEVIYRRIEKRSEVSLCFNLKIANAPLAVVVAFSRDKLQKFDDVLFHVQIHFVRVVRNFLWVGKIFVFSCSLLQVSGFQRFNNLFYLIQRYKKVLTYARKIC